MVPCLYFCCERCMTGDCPAYMAEFEYCTTCELAVNDCAKCVLYNTLACPTFREQYEAEQTDQEG